VLSGTRTHCASGTLAIQCNITQDHSYKLQCWHEVAYRHATSIMTHVPSHSAICWTETQRHVQGVCTDAATAVSLFTEGMHAATRPYPTSVVTVITCCTALSKARSTVSQYRRWFWTLDRVSCPSSTLLLSYLWSLPLTVSDTVARAHRLADSALFYVLLHRDFFFR